MATKTVVQLTDDLDPSLEATDTIRFAFGTTEYEIDLSGEHVDELRSALDKYIQHARKVGGRRASVAPARSARQSSSQQPAGRRTDLSQVRQWAASNGVELSTRGRIAGGVLAAYDAKDVKALRAASGTPEPSARPARRSRAKAKAVTARTK
jgi:nucleoid-associated protein Lsr2